MPKTNAERYREWYARQKTGEEVPHCRECDRQLRGKLSKERGLCSRCWQRTDEARAEALARVRQHRLSKKTLG